MTEIDICICTFRRDHIRETLQSLAALVIPDGVTMRVIVADNDDHPTAQTLVEETARDLGLSLFYTHAPARNISIARNACLDAATASLVAFIDDDELATPTWLAELLVVLGTSDADAVLGPVEAVYPKSTPAWMIEADFHSTQPVFVGDDIRTGYTCNVLFNAAAPAFTGLRFRPGLGRSGGEDTAFFAEAVTRGARIAYAPKAVVTEEVTPDRSRLGWLIKRRFRSGQTHAVLILDNERESRPAHIARAAAKAGFCFTLAALTIIWPSQMKYWLLRGTLHAGVVARLMGRAEIEQYGMGG